MKKCIVTFAKNQEFEDMLSTTLPTFYKYGVKYSYDIWVPSYEEIKSICSLYKWNYNRPASWLKIPIIKNALRHYDVVLWLDCDVVITNRAPDITEYLNNNLQALTIHRDLYEGFVPNAGVWLISSKNITFMDKIWNNIKFIDHHWWEQMSIIDLMRWVPKSQTQSLSEYGIKTFDLPFEFNVHKNDIRYNNTSLENGYFLHATMWPDRKNIMEEWVEKYA